jgi:hypothetical protein
MHRIGRIALAVLSVYEGLDPTIRSYQLLGKLTGGLATEGFDTSALTTFSWQRYLSVEEIRSLKAALDEKLFRVGTGTST